MTRQLIALCALAAVTTGCGSSPHDVLRAAPPPSSSPSETPPPLPTPTAAVSPTPYAVVPPRVLRPQVTRSPDTAQPTPTRTPKDSRPTATVVVINRASMTIDAVVGDRKYRLLPGARSTREFVHVDPSGNTGVGVARTDAPGCGAGGPKLLAEGHSYTVTVADTDSCAPQGVREPSPNYTLSEP
jgi:hypothetical protein